MINLKSTFRYIIFIVLIMSLILIGIVGFINTWKTTNDIKVDEYFLYESSSSPKYQNIEELTLVDTISSMGQFIFAEGNFNVGFDLEQYIKNSGKKYIVEFSNPFFYRLNLYKIGSNGSLTLLYKAGTSVKNPDSLVYPRPFFEFEMEDIKDVRVLAIVQSNDPVGFELVLGKRDIYFRKYAIRM